MAMCRDEAEDRHVVSQHSHRQGLVEYRIHFKPGAWVARQLWLTYLLVHVVERSPQAWQPDPLEWSRPMGHVLVRPAFQTDFAAPLANFTSLLPRLHP